MREVDKLGSNDELEVAIAYSGGADSTAVLYYLAEQFCRLKRKKCVFYLLTGSFNQLTFGKTCESAESHMRRLTTTYLMDGYTFFHQVIKIPSLFHNPECEPFRTVGYKPPEMHWSPNVVDYETADRPYSYAYIEGYQSAILLELIKWCSKRKVSTLYVGHQYERVEWENLNSFRHRGEDASPQNCDRLNLLQECGFSNWVRLENPLCTLRMNKLEICRYLSLCGVNVAEETYSCQFVPRCGVCDNCKTLEMIQSELR